MTGSAHIFTGQGFDTAQISNYSKSSYFTEVADRFYQIFDKPLPSFADMKEPDIARNEISAAVLCISCLDKIDFVQSQYAPPTYTAGYSVGQYLALHHAGCINRVDLISIVFTRCKFMNEAAAKTKATLVAIVGIPLSTIVALINENGLTETVLLSNDNAIGNYTFAVALPEIEGFMELCLKGGAYRAKCLNTTGGWHSEFVASALPEFEKSLGDLNFTKPSIKLIDNTHVDETSLNPEHIQRTLYEHLVQPVRWRETIKYFVAQEIDEVFEVSDFDLLTRMGALSSRKLQFTSLGAT